MKATKYLKASIGKIIIKEPGRMGKSIKPHTTRQNWTFWKRKTKRIMRQYVKTLSLQEYNDYCEELSGLKN